MSSRWLVPACALLLTGCLYQDVLDAHGDRLDLMVPGLSVDRVRAEFPSVELAEVRQVGDRRVEAHEFTHRWRRTTRRDDADVYREAGVEATTLDHYETGWVTQQVWFYVCEGVLVRWGSPGTWPDEPEIVRALAK